MRTLFLLAGSVLASFAAFTSVSAAAQDVTEDSALEGDRLTVGAGVVYNPSYRGSDDYVGTIFPAVQGQLGGIGINPRAGGIALDLIPDNRDNKIGFSLGPVAVYSANRARQIKDPVVRAAGKLDEAIEVGGTAGITAYKLLNPYDSLTLSTDVRWDVNGAYKGMIVTPSVTYTTPLSRGALVALNVGARHVDDKYARYYYSVSPLQGARTGGALPLYNADGGFESVNVGLIGGYDLDGNLLNGGFAIFAVGAYSKMLNDAKRSPYVNLRGDADQWIGGAGLAYTF